jgi:hypothetical protein
MSFGPKRKILHFDLTNLLLCIEQHSERFHQVFIGGSALELLNELNMSAVKSDLPGRRSALMSAANPVSGASTICGHSLNSGFPCRDNLNILKLTWLSRRMRQFARFKLIL